MKSKVADETGNCYAACIASITGIPFDEIKADVGPPETWTRDREVAQHNRLVGLLHEKGWAILFTGTRIPQGLSIATGNSPRGAWAHCWVAKDGKPYFDPHPSGLFTQTVIQYEVLIKIVGLLPESKEGE